MTKKTITRDAALDLLQAVVQSDYDGSPAHDLDPADVTAAIAGWVRNDGAEAQAAIAALGGPAEAGRLYVAAWESEHGDEYAEEV